jgi:formate dehydrogenase major subunit
MTVATTRRGFLKIAALATAALGVGVDAQAVPFKATKTTWELGEIGGKDLQSARVVPVICPYCSMGCSIDMYVAGDRIMWSRGSTDSPINFGALCPKGKAAFQLVENELRVTKPLIRTGPKPPPEEILSAKTWDELVAVVKKYPPRWREATWDEALQYIAQRLAKILNDWRAATGAPR